MNSASLATRLKDALVSTDDGALMRYAFFGLLVAAGAFVAIDLREMSVANASIPGHDPLRTDAPVLPPALTDGVPQAPPVQPGSPPEVLRQPIRFELGSGGELLAEGSIDVGAATRFAQEIEARGEYVKTVSLNSPGGSVDDALAISKLIRENKLSTKVAGKALCASSCPLVLAGGVSRQAEEDAVIGVHQVFNGGQIRPSPEEAMSGAQNTTARIARHLDEMGIEAGLWINALETPPDRLYYLTAEEMARFKLTTGAVATAEAGDEADHRSGG
nr:periplasmic protein [Rhizobium sp. Q54]